MPENIRPQHPALPSNPPASKGAAANVGADAGSQIRPQPAVGIQPPANPPASKGAVPNVNR
jgi:hypothetical protein